MQLRYAEVRTGRRKQGSKIEKMEGQPQKLGRTKEGGGRNTFALVDVKDQGTEQRGVCETGNIYFIRNVISATHHTASSL
jgi:hypothetical protein